MRRYSKFCYGLTMFKITNFGDIFFKVKICFKDFKRSKLSLISTLLNLLFPIFNIKVLQFLF